MAARKASTIGSNPLDQVVPIRPQEPHPEPEPEPTKTPRERVTISLPAELMERARNAVYWTPGATLAGLVEDAVADALDQIERENGGAFKSRSANLKPGRRMKV
jgi:hypothetical protein